MKRSFRGLLPFGTFVGLAAFMSAESIHAEPAPSRADAERRYSRVVESLPGHLLAGTLADWVEEAVGQVPVADRGGWDNLYLGDLLFDYRPDLSRPLHEEAVQRLPNEGIAWLEVALERHRAGDCVRALEAYAACLRLLPSEERVGALVAECRLATGDFKGAVDAWRGARHASNHTGIDFILQAVFGKPSPWRRRQDLLSALRSDDHAVVPSLIALDRNFDFDPWNSRRNDEALAADLVEVKNRLGESSREWIEIGFWLRTAEAAEAGDLGKIYREAGWFLGPEGKLPFHPTIALHVVGHALGLGVLDAPTLLGRYGAQLEAAAFGEKPNEEWADLWLGLQADAESTVAAEAELRAWRQFGKPRFAAAHLTLLGQSRPLRLDAELGEAVRQFPFDAHIAGLALQVAREQGKKGTSLLPWIAGAIRAESRELLGQYGMPDSYRLKGFYALLEEALR